jgi:hypothetical protein
LEKIKNSEAGKRKRKENAISEGQQEKEEAKADLSALRVN